MFGITHSRKVDSSILLMSELYDENSFYTKFFKDVASAKKSILIESPYLTVKRSSQFTEILKQNSRHDLEVALYTRNPTHHDGLLESQAWAALKILKSSGIRILMCDDMRHRKLAIIDDSILWEGSLNILSQNESREIMRRTTSKALCQQMNAFI
jgi:hypothetical protein